MKDITVSVSLPGYLREWLHATLGDPVRFPARSAENVLLSRLVGRRPKEAAPEAAGAGWVRIVLPDNPWRRPEFYNYLGRRGRAELAGALERLFRLALWSECAGLLGSPGELNRGLDAWCARRGISLGNREAVRQKFYRMRRDYGACGIVLGRKFAKRLPR